MFTVEQARQAAEQTREERSEEPQSDKEPAKRIWLNTAQAAEYTGFSPFYIGQQTREGTLRAYKKGNQYRYLRRDLDIWMMKDLAGA